MPPDAIALYAAVILLLPMVCFFLSSPTFLLVGLEIPEVTQLLRGLFNGYFLVMGVAGVVSTGGLRRGRPAGLRRRRGRSRNLRDGGSPLVSAAD